MKYDDRYSKLWVLKRRTMVIMHLPPCSIYVETNQVDRWQLDGWWDGWMMVIWGELMYHELRGWHTTGWALQSAECVSRPESSSSQCPVSEADLWGYTIRIQGCIYSTQRSHMSSSDRRLLTVIGCYLGGCQLKRQLSTLWGRWVCLECQRSGALDVWSALSRRLGFRVLRE